MSNGEINIGTWTLGSTTIMNESNRNELIHRLRWLDWIMFRECRWEDGLRHDYIDAVPRNLEGLGVRYWKTHSDL